MQTLSNFHNKANQGKFFVTEKYDPELMRALEENNRLKRQLKVVEEKRGVSNEEE
ncbi:MAG: transposase [Moraxellaceae bacterium]|jgi:transposase